MGKREPWHHPVYGDPFKDPLEDVGMKMLAAGLLGGFIAVIACLVIELVT